MKETRIIMGMPITIEIIASYRTDALVSRIIELAFSYFRYVDSTFSVFKPESEISKINRGESTIEQSSVVVRKIHALCEQTKRQTFGYFNAFQNHAYNPAGIVKGWAIDRVAKLLNRAGYSNFCINAGGDIQTSGFNVQHEPWRIGIQNPLAPYSPDGRFLIKSVSLFNKGIATSGTSIRGNHIYNPHSDRGEVQSDIVSLTVIAPGILDADRFATAAFAMGREGMRFILQFPQLQAYMVDSSGVATFTPGFSQFVNQ